MEILEGDKINLQELEYIVFEKQKCPYYIERHDKTTLFYIVDKEGMNVYWLKGDREMVLKKLIPFNELTNDDLYLLSQKLPREQLEEFLMGYNKEVIE